MQLPSANLQKRPKSKDLVKLINIAKGMTDPRQLGVFARSMASQSQLMAFLPLQAKLHCCGISRQWHLQSHRHEQQDQNLPSDVELVVIHLFNNRSQSDQLTGPFHFMTEATSIDRPGDDWTWVR